MSSTRASQQRRGFRLHGHVLRGLLRVTSVGVRRTCSAVLRSHARYGGRERREVGRHHRVLGDVGRPRVSRVDGHGGRWGRRERLRANASVGRLACGVRAECVIRHCVTPLSQPIKQSRAGSAAAAHSVHAAEHGVEVEGRQRRRPSAPTLIAGLYTRCTIHSRRRLSRMHADKRPAFFLSRAHSTPWIAPGPSTESHKQRPGSKSTSF